MFHVKQLVAVMLVLLMAGRARAADRLDVILDWFVNANHESLLAAKYSGAYARQNLDVHFIVPTRTSLRPAASSRASSGW